MAKVTQKSYQGAIEDSLGDERYSDDNEDITEDTLNEEGISTGRTTTTKRGGDSSEVDDEEETELEEDDEGSEEYVDDESSKEPVYKKDQVQKIVQTRVNTYTKRIQRLARYKEAVDRICDVTGLDFDKLTARLSAMTDEQQAQILGVPVEKVREARQVRQEINQERGKNLQLSRQLEETQLKADPRYHDFDLFKEEIDEILDESPQLSVKQAYILAKGDTVSVTANRNARQAEIARRVNARSKGVVKPVTGPKEKTPKLDAIIVSAAKAIGMDPAEYAMYQGIKDIDSYRAMKAKLKK